MATATAPVVTSRSNATIVFFIVFFAVTALSIYDKDARVFDPASPIAQHFVPAKWFVIVHGFFGGVAMVVAAFQFSNRLRARYLYVHRTVGYAYVTSVFISAPLAVVVALKLSRSPSQFVANCMNSFGWLITTVIALYCGQYRPAPPLDDPQLPVGNGVHLQPLRTCIVADYTRGPTWLRSDAMVIERTRGFSTEHFPGMACHLPAKDRKSRNSEQGNLSGIRAVHLKSLR